MLERLPGVAPSSSVATGPGVLGRHVVPHVGDHVVVLDPSGSRSATGTVMEVRCEGGRVRVEHDGSSAQWPGPSQSASGRFGFVF